MRLLNRSYILRYKASPDPRQCGYEVDYPQSGKLTFDAFPSHLPKREALEAQQTLSQARSGIH